jgi:Uma2 family endonuclease
MIQTQLLHENLPFILRLNPILHITEEQFYGFCRLNRELRIERTSEGDIAIMPPTGGETSNWNSEINMQLRIWAKQNGAGVVFDSSCGFILPNGAIRSPDSAWVARSRLIELSQEQKRKFLPLCPDFVLELRSPTDSVTALQERMKEYIANGTQLGWLIVPDKRHVYIYRPNEPVECLENCASISGETVLPGFVLSFQEIWQPSF